MHERTLVTLADDQRTGRDITGITIRALRIDATREYGPLWEAIEHLSALERLHRETRALTMRPGRFFVYEAPFDGGRFLVMEHHPIGIDAGEEGAIIRRVMRDDAYPTWGVSCYLEGYEGRSRDRTRFNMRAMDRQDLAEYYAGWRMW